jgi:hypothetical protein
MSPHGDEIITTDSPVTETYFLNHLPVDETK